MIRRPSQDPKKRPREHGLALAMVLGGLVILSMISIALLSRAGQDITAANVTVERARATTLVEGAIETATLSLFGTDARRRLRDADGVLVVDIAGTEVTTHVRDACGLWDINSGGLDILSGLLKQSGAAEVALITNALITARTVDAGLLSIEQIRALPGMSADLYQRLRGEITVNCRADRVDHEFASPTLLAAIPDMAPDQVASIIRQRKLGPIDPGLLGASARYLAPGPGQTYEIIAVVDLGPGSRVFRRAEITLTHQPNQPYRVLSWATIE
jgi:type II secretory pathway component PulK